MWIHSEQSVWCMAQKQKMFCLFPFASMTLGLLGMQGLYPGSICPGIDKINLALWWTLGYVSDPVFWVHLTMCFIICGVGRIKIRPHLSLRSHSSSCHSTHLFKELHHRTSTYLHINFLYGKVHLCWIAHTLQQL